MTNLPSPPEPKGARELNIGDQWRALYVRANEVPEGLPVIHATVLAFRSDRAYAVRRHGARHYRALETDISPGSDYAEAIRDAVREQAHISAGRVELTGYLDCKATMFNPDFEQGTRAARVIAIVAAGEVEDMPEDAAYERRRLRSNDVAKMIREQHRELERPLSDALDRYMVLQARGEI